MFARTFLILLAGIILFVSNGKGQPTTVAFEYQDGAGNSRGGNPPSRFMRIVNGGDSVRSSLELAIVRYGMPDCGTSCPEVDLIAVTHVAEAAYYENINRLLPSYDVVLYEFVAPDSAFNPASMHREPSGGLHQLYSLLAGLLGMQFQIGGITYTGENMLHADLHRSEFLALLDKSGESLPDFDALIREIHGSLPPELRDPDNIDLGARCRLRRMAAVKLMKPDGKNELFGDVYIIPRNDKVAHILREQIDAGRKRIAILYGAGHMPDLQERLLSDFGMQPLKRRWLMAWDLCKIVTH